VFVILCETGGLDKFIWQSFSGQFRNKIMELVWKGHSDSAINGKHVLSVQPGPRARQVNTDGAESKRSFVLAPNH